MQAEPTHRILLVEDNPADAELTAEAIQFAGLNVALDVATSVEQALAMLRRTDDYSEQPRPDLILLDLNLPRREGREGVREIKSDPFLRTIPVLIMSSSQAITDVRDSYALHANGYIVKPVDFERFVHLLQQINQFWFEAATLVPNTDKERL